MLGDMRVHTMFGKVALALSLSAIFPVHITAAQEDLDSANYVIKGCREFIALSRSDYLKQGLCIGAVKAIVKNYPGLCRPEQLPTEQAVRAVIAYIDSRPARLQENFYSLAVEAIRSAWPCRR